MKKYLRIFFVLWGTVIFFFGYEIIGNFRLLESSTTARAASSADKSDNSGSGNGQLYVYVEPANADIKLLNLKEAFNQGIQLKPGQYRLEISAQKHITERYTVKIVTGQVTAIKVLLPVGDNAQDIYRKKVGFEDIYRMSGLGAPSKKNKDTELGKQEAFIAAFALALGKCFDLIQFSVIDDFSYQSADLKTGDLLYHFNYLDYIFYDKGKTMQKAHLFQCVYYKGKRLFMFIEPFMKSPEIKVANFPSWRDLPFSISGINIVDVAFSSDSDDVFPTPEGGAKVTIEVPVTTLELIRYQKQDWGKVFKNESFEKTMMSNELDKLDFTDKRDDAKSSK